jgi:hypothetical protein
MAATHGKGTVVYLDGYSYGDQLRQVDLDDDAGLTDITCFIHTTGARVVPGIHTATMNLQGLLHTAEAATLETWANSLLAAAVNSQVFVRPGGAIAEGDVGYAASVRAASLKRSVPHDDVCGITLDLAINGQLTRCQVIWAKVQGTQLGGTAYELGALSATQMLSAFWFVTAVGEDPSVAGTVDSDDAEAFADATVRATSTTVTAIGAQRMDIAGPVTDTWWRFNQGNGGTLTSVVVAGIVNLETI